MGIMRVDSITKGAFNKSTSKNELPKQNKDESSGFSSIMAAECHKYTDDEDKINSVIKGGLKC